MKKKLILFILTFITLSVSAQLERQDAKKNTPTTIGEVKQMGTFVANLEFLVEDSDTLYLLHFRNSQYMYNVDIKQVKFLVSDGLLDTLYNILSTAIDAEKDSITAFKLGNEDIEVQTQKVIGFKGIRITLKRNGAFFGLNRKQLDRLFNRKDN